MKGSKERSKKGRTMINRSVNLGTNGRVVQLRQRELKRLVADVALYFRNIRSDLNGNVGDSINGSIRRIS